MANHILTRDLNKTGAPLSSANALERINEGSEAIYVDRDWTPDQESPCVTTLRSNKLNKVSRSPLYPAVYAASAKGGKQVVAKREILVKHTGADGVIYQDPLKVTISCEVGNGLINYYNTLVGGRPISVEIAREIRKVIDVLTCYEQESSGNWNMSSTQAQLDAMLWGSAEWKNIPTPYSATLAKQYDDRKITVGPDGIILSEVAAEADKNSK